MQTARVFTNGNSQAVRLPKAFRLETRTVFIRKDAISGDIVLSARQAPGGWEDFFALRARTRMPADFLLLRPLNDRKAARDPFATPLPRNSARRK
jgi:antitoxin VapB